MESYESGSISAMFGVLGRSYCVEVSIFDKASQRNAAALRMDDLRIGGFIEYACRRLLGSWRRKRELVFINVNREVDELLA
jgi:hypothetical protein